VFVPHLAMSGGTLVALAAGEIVMCAHAVLGPIDPQVKNFPAASLLKVVKEKPIAEIDDETLILADVGGKATEQVRRACVDLLAGRMAGDKAEELAQTLTSGRWTHDYPITPEEATSLGLRVVTDMPEEVLELMALYPQPMRTMPTVEYLPTPPRPPFRPAGR
jgi:ClpP class serine protease